MTPRERSIRALFTFVGGAGHYEPLVPIARAALAAGHAVEFACRPSMVPVVIADGFTAHATGPDVPELPAITPLLAPDPDREDRDLVDGFARWNARARAADVGALCAERRPDMVVADEVDYGSLIAAERHGVPYATVLVLVAGSFARVALLSGPLNEVRAEHGLPDDEALAMLARHLVVAPFPPSFRDPAAPLPPTAYPVRPAVLTGDLAAPARPAGGARPTVYLTLGTIFNMESGDLFARALAGLRQLPVDVVATVGRQLDPAAFGPQPPHVRIERFVPQAEILPRCDLVVSHGGSGSVIGALAFGLPSVLLPMGADQPHNARRCEQLGIGRVLDPVHATAGDIAAAVGEVIADARYASRARVLQAETAALPDAATVVPRLERLAS